MADYKVSDTSLTSIANAIRTKGGTSASLSFPDGFVSAIQNIPTGGGSTLITKSIDENGTYAASSDNADGYSSVTVAVPVLFEYDYTYTVSESWESGKTGETMAAAVMNGHSVEDALAYCMILRNNTSTSSYRADAIIVSNQSNTGWLYRNNYGMAVSLGSSGQATQGTLVDLYVAKIPS